MDSRFAPFPTTCWDSVERAAKGVASAEETAVFMRRYWRPVYSFLRQQHRLDRHDAEDLTQAFFAKFMESGWLARADRSRGRMRTFLITLLKRFARDQAELRQGRFERESVGWEVLRADSTRPVEPEDAETPEAAFERSWTRDLCERAWERLCRECGDGDRGWWPRALEAWFASTEDGRPTYAVLAAQLEVTENQLRNALERGKRLFRELIEEEVRETLAQPEAAAMSDELSELLAKGTRR